MPAAPARPATTTIAPSSVRITAWDAPVRAFHWTLAALGVFSFTTGHLGGAWLAWHMRSGYCLLALVVFRVAWGLVGSDTARFGAFVRGPRAAIAYARALRSGRLPKLPGHNPLGGWMVLALLASIAVQAFSGLFVDDEIATQGPLAARASEAFVARMGHWHHVNQWVLVALVALHVIAIALYWKLLRTDLVRPMIDGQLEVADGAPVPRMRSTWLALALLGASAAAVYGLVVVYPAGP